MKLMSGMKYKAILFDLDGTLADTSRGIYNAIRHTEKLLNLESISAEQMRLHIGPPPEESFQRSFGLSGANLKKAVTIYRQYSLEYGLYEAEIYNDMLELLMVLKGLEYKLGVVTLKSEEIAIKMLRYLNVASYFDVIKGTHPDLLIKKSTLLNLSASQLLLNRSDCVLIGDSDYDAIAAQEVGIDFIGVLYGFGFRTEADVKKYKDTSCVRQVKEIRNFLAV
jgi:phosphoglycolate phosphatase